MQQACDPCRPTVWWEAARRSGSQPEAAAGQLPDSWDSKAEAQAEWQRALHAALTGRLPTSRGQEAGWSRLGLGGAMGAGRWQVAGSGGRQCGREMGRWVTAFRRRVGRWVTDVTALRGLLDGDRWALMCTIPTSAAQRRAALLLQRWATRPAACRSAAVHKLSSSRSSCGPACTP
jgi:hypothetical protein